MRLPRRWFAHDLPPPDSLDLIERLPQAKGQIIGMIKVPEADLPTAEVCRRHGLSPASFYKLKAEYSGMDNTILKDLLGKV